jgi:hypothetical protein
VDEFVVQRPFRRGLPMEGNRMRAKACFADFC